jgi:glycosyltransferase involved in cell wall biosynthesis
LLAGYAVSPAAVRWQIGLLRAIKDTGYDVVDIGHISEAAWPRGTLLMPARRGALPAAIAGTLVGYINAPFGRVANLAAGYCSAARAIIAERGPPAAIVTYNFYQPLVACALAVRVLARVPWVLVSADRNPGLYWSTIRRLPEGMVFLSWGDFAASDAAKKLHIDGGATAMRPAGTPATPLRIVYTGYLATHTGLDLLAETFERMQRRDIELWICGKGRSPAAERLAARDNRVRLRGLISDDELTELCAKAAVFVNPRLPDVDENKYNFPSKVLEYLSYGIPVVSTWTEGLAPEYRDILQIAEPTPASLGAALEACLAWTPAARGAYYEKARAFVAGDRSWASQAAKLTRFIEALAR